MSETLCKVLLEDISGSHNKFYEVSIQTKNQGRTYQVVARWGRRSRRSYDQSWMHSGGQEQIKINTKYLATAERKSREVIRAKQAKGYTIVENPVDAPPPKQKATRKAKSDKEISLERFSLIASDL